jgi:hypothetical protein
MSIQARSILPSTIAALAASLSLVAFPPLHRAANAAETCLAGPKGAAPQGSHWYYRLERDSQRKCWHLVQKDQKGQRAAAPAEPQGDADEEVEAAATPPAAKKSVGRVTEPAPKAAQAPVTKDASDTTEATAPVPWPDPPAAMMPRVDAPSPPAPAEQPQNDSPAPAAIVQQPVQQPVAAADSTATVAVTAGTSALQFVFVAIALLGLLACAMFYIAGARRRRTDVLNKAQHLNALPAELPAAADAPTFQPLPPMDLMPRHDDVEEAMQRFTERWKRRAA